MAVGGRAPSFPRRASTAALKPRRLRNSTATLWLSQLYCPRASDHGGVASTAEARASAVAEAATRSTRARRAAAESAVRRWFCRLSASMIS